MNLPEQPSTFRPPTESERPWWWRLENAAGEEVRVEGHLGTERFSNQSDAESWVGEVFAELAAEGVDAVTLFELERRVYGPMSLHP
ncbi:hypothetical protein [Nocardioides deserti]|uniref:Uncharacterized protein n=1 Tax=Nocardioides deserti TaxID=1588644 RepID=A0ABR6U6D7_9ACTN|nr:hypothetical protein [Nocardioides deserti]MBC2959999.1 hypothetical protein [Nocardioides deserti]GGO75230.1 hypothetical protein GCM10012276_25090 [Nocardioides deserti]